jgi:hypothetical protein
MPKAIPFPFCAVFVSFGCGLLSVDRVALPSLCRLSRSINQWTIFSVQFHAEHGGAIDCPPPVLVSMSSALVLERLGAMEMRNRPVLDRSSPR